ARRRARMNENGVRRPARERCTPLRPHDVDLASIFGLPPAARAEPRWPTSRLLPGILVEPVERAAQNRAGPRHMHARRGWSVRLPIRQLGRYVEGLLELGALLDGRQVNAEASGQARP